MKLQMIAFCSVYLATTAASAQELKSNGHPKADERLHTEFYQHWLQQDGETSCCNGKDCYPTQAYFNKNTGLWMALRREDGKWITIPKKVYNNEDPNRPESPDGQSHLCARDPNDVSTLEYIAGNVVEVFCFRAGTGT